MFEILQQKNKPSAAQYCLFVSLHNIDVTLVRRHQP